MNCIDYRRHLGSEPVESAAMREHRLACPRCSEHFARSQGFERSLRAAINVAVPDDLAQSILLRQTTARRHRWPHRSGWLALAASTLLACGLAVVLWPRLQTGADDELVQLAIDHYLHEPYALDERPEVPLPLLRGSASRVGLALAEVPEPVSYAAACPMGSYRSLHLVVRREATPVTLFLVPGLHAGDRRFEHDGIHARAVSMSGGTLLALSERGDLLDGVVADWQGSAQLGSTLAAGAR